MGNLISRQPSTAGKMLGFRLTAKAAHVPASKAAGLGAPGLICGRHSPGKGDRGTGDRGWGLLGGLGGARGSARKARPRRPPTFTTAGEALRPGGLVAQLVRCRLEAPARRARSSIGSACGGGAPPPQPLPPLPRAP